LYRAKTSTLLCCTDCRKRTN